MLHATVHTFAAALAAIPVDPGSAVTPPGGEKVLVILRWALWIGFAACLAGLVKAGAGMAMAGSGRSSGGAHEHGMGVALALLGAILCSSAALLVGSFA